MATKDFLYCWLGKNKKVVPIYTVEPVNRGGVSRFKCTVRVPGYAYSGMGNSTNKKDAQTNAANDFLNFLVRNGDIAADETPALVVTGSLESASQPTDDSGWSDNNSQPGYQKPTAQPIIRNQLTNRDLYVTQRADEVAQSEAVDLKAEIHGGWTAENSKQALNEFMQKVKQPQLCYTTAIKEANFSRDFCSTLTCYIPHVGKELRAEGRASTKKMSEAFCAMSMVRQLYHMNLMAAYQGKRVKIKSKNLPPVQVKIEDGVFERLSTYLSAMGVAPAEVNLDAANPDVPQSLLVDHKLAHFPDSEIFPACNVSWSPPQQNWNPWRACNIDEPPLASMTLDDISQLIAAEEAKRFINEDVQKTRQELPVAAFKEQIIETVANNQVTLIKGETGCGKSTQVAQYLMESYFEKGKGSEFNAFISQPRRISAISLAERVAAERGEELGVSVGYSVRFDTVSPRPYGAILFCTVGVLLRKMESGLRGVSHVIIDEIHERDIDTDFVLVVLREMVKEFPNLRLVLMSATINTAMFTEYFGGCPIIEMPGRTFNVETFFLEDIFRITQFVPPEPVRKRKEEEEATADEDKKQKNLNILPEDAPPMLKHAMGRISENEIPIVVIEKILLDICTKGQDGAILIFLPGWQEIMQLLTHLMTHNTFSDANRFIILPLHSQLTGAEQRRVFEHFPEGMRKIILATNIAESSITIDDVVFVIDSCKSRERLYSSNNNMVHYATVWASRSNIKQRSGRAGRVRDGFAFHLCSKQRYEVLDEHRTAEILRTPLTAVALTIKLLHLGSVGDFLAKAIEPPPLDMVVEAETLLQNMGALDRNLEMTALGRILAKLPIEPILGKTIVMAASFGIGYLMCQLAAASSFSTPFVPRERTHTRLNNAQRSLAGTRWSDHVTLISVNQRFAEATEQGPNAEQSLCERFSLSPSMLKMSRGALQQLLDTLAAVGFPPEVLAVHLVNVEGEDTSIDLLTSLIVAAYYPNVGFHRGRRKLYTLEQASALTSKMSVLTPFKGDLINLPSPLVVFSEKIRSNFVQCKDITVLNALQLLLFGSRKVECIGADQVRLDDMIILQIDPKLAAAVVALRPCIEAHLIRTAMNPEGLSTMCELDRELGQILRLLSSPALFSEADKRDYLLTDSAMQGMQPVNKFSGYQRGGGRGGGFGRGHGAGSHNQWGFGGGDLLAPRYPADGNNAGFDSNPDQVPLGGDFDQRHNYAAGTNTPGFCGNPNQPPLGYESHLQRGGGGKWAWSRGGGGGGGRGRGRRGRPYGRGRGGLRNW